jgi:hypothetical protein
MSTAGMRSVNCRGCAVPDETERKGGRANKESRNTKTKMNKKI